MGNYILLLGEPMASLSHQRLIQCVHSQARSCNSSASLRRPVGLPPLSDGICGGAPQPPRRLLCRQVALRLGEDLEADHALAHQARAHQARAQLGWVEAGV